MLITVEIIFWLCWFKSALLKFYVSFTFLMQLLENLNLHLWLTFVVHIIFLLGSATLVLASSPRRHVLPKMFWWMKPPVFVNNVEILQSSIHPSFLLLYQCPLDLTELLLAIYCAGISHVLAFEFCFWETFPIIHWHTWIPAFFIGWGWVPI